MMQRDDVKRIAKEKGVHLWEIADELKLHESRFHTILRHPLSDGMERMVLLAIDRVVAKKGAEQ